MLILPADLPLLDAPVARPAAGCRGRGARGRLGPPLVVIAPLGRPRRHERVAAVPARRHRAAFGPRSFEAHVRAAAAADATLQVVTDRGLGFDLDTPEDLERLHPACSATLEALGAASVASA